MRTGWHDSPVSYGAIGRLTIQAADAPTMHVSSVQLDPLGDGRLAVGASRPRVRVRLDRVVRPHRRTGPPNRVERPASCPSIVDEGPFIVARWVHAPNGPDDRSVDEHARTTRSIDAAGVHRSAPAPTVNQMFDRLVDGIARGLLSQSGWRAELGKQRRPDLQATARHLRRTLQARLRRPRQHPGVRRSRWTTSATNSNGTGVGRAANPSSCRGCGSSCPTTRSTLGRAARTRRRRRLVTMVHRQRRVGSQRRRERRRPRGTPPRPARRHRDRHGHAHRVHPRPGRPRTRTRTHGDRARPRRRRGLHRHRSGRTAAPRHRTDRTRTTRALTRHGQR